LRAGADVHARNTENITAVHTAASKGFVPCLEALIFAGAEVNGCGKRLCTPLHFAAHDGHLDCVQLYAQPLPPRKPAASLTMA